MKNTAFTNLSLQDMEGEIWKDIKDFEGYYQISNFGRVKSLQRKVWIIRGNGYYQTINERIIKQREHSHNHRMNVGLNLLNQRYDRFISRLVYSAFIGKIPTKLYVFHKDFNSKNNNMNNLYLGDDEDVSNISSKRNKKKSKYKGVCIEKGYKNKKRIRMYININRKTISKGCKTELEGAKLYDYYIKKYNLKRKGNFINK